MESVCLSGGRVCFIHHTTKVTRGQVQDRGEGYWTDIQSGGTQQRLFLSVTQSQQQDSQLTP